MTLDGNAELSELHQLTALETLNGYLQIRRNPKLKFCEVQWFQANVNHESGGYSIENTTTVGCP